MDPFARLKRAVGLDTTPRKEDYPKWIEATELMDAHQYQEAERLLQQILEEVRDTGDSDTAIGMISADLARAQWRLHQFEQARQTVEAARELLGGRRASAGLADCLEIQANLIRDEGGSKEDAVELYREALAIQKKFPQDADKLTRRYRDLGTALLGVDQEESRELLEHAIQIGRDQRGNESLLVVLGLAELARHQAFLGERAEALDTIKEAASIEADGSASWPTNTEMLESIAITLVQATRLEDALYYYEHALKIAECRIGVDVIHLAGLMTGLAEIHRNAGNDSAALELLQQAVGKLQGRSTFHLPVALESLGDCYAQLGRFSEALKSYETALECWLKEPDLHQDRIEENQAILDSLRKQVLARTHPATAKSKIIKKKAGPNGTKPDEPTQSPTTISAEERAKFKLPKANFRSPAKPKPKPKEKEPTVIPVQIPSNGTVVVTGLAPGASPPAGMGGFPPAGSPATPPGGYRAGGTLFSSGSSPANPAGGPPNGAQSTPPGKPGAPGAPATANAGAADKGPDGKKDEKKDEKNGEVSREQTRAERRLRTRRPNPGAGSTSTPPANGPVVVTPGTGFMVSSGSAAPPPGTGVPLSHAGSLNSGSSSYAQPLNRGGAGDPSRVPGSQQGGGPAPNSGSPGSTGRSSRRDRSAPPGGHPQANQGAGTQGPVFHGVGSTPAGSGAPGGIPGRGPGGSAFPGGGVSGGGAQPSGGTVGGNGFGQPGAPGSFGPGGPGGGSGSGGYAGPGGPDGNAGPFSGPGGVGGAHPNPVTGSGPGSGRGSVGGSYAPGSGQPQAGQSGPGGYSGGMPGGSPVPPAVGYAQPGAGGPYPAGPNAGGYPYGPSGGGNAFADAGPGGIRFLDPAGQPMHPMAPHNVSSEMQLTVQVPGAKPLPDGSPVNERLSIPLVPPQELRGWDELEFELLG